MKSFPCVLLMLAACITGVSEATSGDRAVTKVVKMLKAMLAKSKEDGDKDRKIYAKFLCYCNTNKADTTGEIKTRTKEIALLESKIEELRGSTGELSSECAKLAADIDSNEKERSKAMTIRAKEEKSYNDFKGDMETGIKLLSSAIKTLAEVGADQDLEESGNDHEKFMAGYGKNKKKKSLLGLDSTMKEALSAAAAFLPLKHQQTVTAFLQAPNTGSYSAQSGEVVGILKDMRDTFKSNLASATIQEKKTELEFARWFLAKIAAFKDMEKVLKAKKGRGG